MTVLDDIAHRLRRAARTIKPAGCDELFVAKQGWNRNSRAVLLESDAGPMQCNGKTAADLMKLF